MQQKRIIQRSLESGDAESAFAEGVHPLLQRIYKARGVRSPDELDRSLHALLPVQELDGAEQAAELLADALIRNQQILIVGDFDCDGATSTALCMLALHAMGCTRLDYLVPNRFDYGYGLTPEIVALAE